MVAGVFNITLLLQIKLGRYVGIMYICLSKGNKAFVKLRKDDKIR